MCAVASASTLVNRLREAWIGVECRGQRIPALMYADDKIILADDKKMLRRALNKMGECCVYIYVYIYIYIYIWNGK